MELFLAVATLVVGLIGLYFMREQTKLMRQSLPSRQRKIAEQQAWWRAPPVIAVACLTVLAWVPWVYELEFPSVEVAFNQFSEGVLPNGDLFFDADLRDNKPDKKVIAVAFRQDPSVNANDATGLLKSTRYDYTRGPGHFIIPASREFWLVFRQTQATSIVYQLLEVPNTVMPDQFSTLAEAFQLGARSITAIQRRPNFIFEPR